MNDYKDAWQPAINAYAIKNNTKFLETQAAAVRLLAISYGIEINDIIIDPVNGSSFDFAVDYLDSHHLEFLNKVEMITETQDIKELDAAIKNMKKEKANG